MGKQEELAKFVRAMRRAGVPMGDFCTVPQGVFFSTRKSANAFAKNHDRELVRVDGQGLAKNKKQQMNRPRRNVGAATGPHGPGLARDRTRRENG